VSFAGLVFEYYCTFTRNSYFFHDIRNDLYQSIRGYYYSNRDKARICVAESIAIFLGEKHNREINLNNYLIGSFYKHVCPLEPELSDEFYIWKVTGKTEKTEGYDIFIYQGKEMEKSYKEIILHPF